MIQDRLCDLVLMRTERHETVKADFDNIIGEFASIKPRNVLFYLAKSNFVFFTKILFFWPQLLNHKR